MIPFPFNENHFSFFVAVVGQFYTKSDSLPYKVERYNCRPRKDDMILFPFNENHFSFFVADHLERILIKLYRQNVSLLVYIYIYIYIYVCVCVCVCWCSHKLQRQ